MALVPVSAVMIRQRFRQAHGMIGSTTVARSAAKGRDRRLWPTLPRATRLPLPIDALAGRRDAVSLLLRVCGLSALLIPCCAHANRQVATRESLVSEFD